MSKDSTYGKPDNFIFPHDLDKIKPNPVVFIVTNKNQNIIGVYGSPELAEVALQNNTGSQMSIFVVDE